MGEHMEQIDVNTLAELNSTMVGDISLYYYMKVRKIQRRNHRIGFLLMTFLGGYISYILYNTYYMNYSWFNEPSKFVISFIATFVSVSVVWMLSKIFNLFSKFGIGMIENDVNNYLIQKYGKSFSPESLVIVINKEKLKDVYSFVGNRLYMDSILNSIEFLKCYKE